MENIKIAENNISKKQGLLIRLDDIAENMNWKLMDKCEKLFDSLNIKPLLGVIPFNKDPERDVEMLNQYRNFRYEAEKIGMRHFLEAVSYTHLTLPTIYSV